MNNEELLIALVAVGKTDSDLKAFKARHAEVLKQLEALNRRKYEVEAAMEKLGAQIHCCHSEGCPRAFQLASGTEEQLPIEVVDYLRDSQDDPKGTIVLPPGWVVASCSNGCGADWRSYCQQHVTEKSSSQCADCGY